MANREAAQWDVLLQKLRDHLRLVQQSPETPLDHQLLEECDAFLAPAIRNSPENGQLVAQIATLLPELRQLPGPLMNLLQSLVMFYTFSQILAMQPPVDFAAGLDLAALPFNAFMIELISRASTSAAQVATLASMPVVVKALVNVWLRSPDMGIADTAGQTIIDLLSQDKEPSSVQTHGVGDAGISKPDQRGGQGLLWRRIFGDKDIYRLILSSCASGPMKERTIAQSRLMCLAPELGRLDWGYLTRSHHPEIETEFGLDPAREGLLDFITVHMVDYKDDVLIHMNLLQCFAELISKIREPSHLKLAFPTPRTSDMRSYFLTAHRHISVSLLFLRDRGLHDRTIAHFLEPDRPEHQSTYLYGPATNYYAEFASHYPDAIFSEHSTARAENNLQSALRRLQSALSISGSRWASGQSPSHDLSVLVSLPRAALLPRASLGTGRASSPLFLIPCKNTNAEALRTLGTVFHGLLPASAGRESMLASKSGEETAAETGALETPLHRAEAAAARALFALYLNNHETLFVDLAAHAGTVALPEKAVESFNLVAALATARWAPLPLSSSSSSSSASTDDTTSASDATGLASTGTYDLTSPTATPSSPHSLPAESSLQSLLAPSTPHVLHSGIATLLSQPIRERIFPAVLRAPSPPAHLARTADPSAAAPRVARARLKCLECLGTALEDESAVRGVERVVLVSVRDAVRRAREGGLWAGEEGARGAGGQVATMEM